MSDANLKPAPKTAFEPDDIYLERRISELHLVAGQPIAVCAVKQALKGADEYGSTLWTFSLDGSDGRQLTWGPGIDDCPRWSPDGHSVAFISDRAGKAPQIHVIRLNGGEARPVTQLECGVLDLAWRPDGKQWLALCGVSVDPDAHAEGGQSPDPSLPAPDPQRPEVVWRLPFKMDGEGYVLNKRLHLFLIDVEGGEATPLTHGDFDVRGFAWSPDGRHITYSASSEEPRRQHFSDLWVLEVDEHGPVGKPRRLSREQANVSQPTWSPDGRWIAFGGSVEVGDAQNRLWLCDVASESVKALGTEDLEVVPEPLQWQPDSQAITFIQAHRGIQRVATISLADGKVEALDPGRRHVTHLAVNERLAYTLEGPGQPLELYSADLDGGNELKLSDFNDWWNCRKTPEVSIRQFKVPDGEGQTEAIDGWLMLPPGREGPSPLLVHVHGGPASYALVDFPSQAYRQILCSKGWAVLALNPVGSSSYGRPFAARLQARWGELDLPQQRAAIRALQQEGIADERLAIAGSSYGGYLSAWAIGDCDWFRAAVVCAPVGNLETHFGTSDSGFYADPYLMEGKPDANRELMFRLSPMARIEKACTPTLFLQGKEDERCPKCQSEEMFVKLRTSGDTPAEMVLYPGGSHHVFGQGKPSHRVDILQRIDDWLHRWIDRPVKGAAVQRQSTDGKDREDGEADAGGAGGARNRNTAPEDPSRERAPALR
jgi:dipeptidyl aminopeptidase/acylaminoacyl peptidase